MSWRGSVGRRVDVTGECENGVVGISCLVGRGGGGKGLDCLDLMKEVIPRRSGYSIAPSEVLAVFDEDEMVHSEKRDCKISC